MNRTRPAVLEFVVVATAVTAIGGFLFGYDTAVINGAISYLKANMGLDADQEGAAGASAILGCIPGAMCAGFLCRPVRTQEDALPLRLFMRSPGSSPHSRGPSSSSSPRGS